ncbi:hypothetical protein H7Y21_00435 [Arenimonas sp.]|nr:hypothetical protein [Candidatus Parcubacteria bacterium]
MKESFSEQVGYVLHERAAKRAEEVYDKKMVGRRMKDFEGVGPYTIEYVASKEIKVKKAEEDFEAKLAQESQEVRSRSEMSKKLADCLEGIILNVKTWFGPTSQIYPTTRYDDYFNGVDLVAERMSGGALNHHGFALDITYAGYTTILKKIERIANKLKKGELGNVDFFKSNDNRFMGQLGEVPLVVIGADGNTMRGLVNMFAEGEDNKIEDHPVQFQIVEQVLIQCEFFIRLANEIQDKEIANRVIIAYTTLKTDFELIKKLKHRLATNIDTGDRDSFHGNLQAALENL